MIKQTMQVICDRCNKHIKDGSYYTININDHEIVNRDDSVRRTGTLLYNCEPAIYKIPQPELHYCSECIGVIRKVMYEEKE